MADNKVSFAETLTIKVGRFLRKQYPNIAFADILGRGREELTKNNSIGLLDDQSAPQLGWWQRLREKPRRRFMGVLWFSNEPRGASHNNWVLEVYGDQNVAFLTGVAERLAEQFGASVHLKLISEDVRYEGLPSDGEM